MKKNERGQPYGKEHQDTVRNRKKDFHTAAVTAGKA